MKRLGVFCMSALLSIGFLLVVHPLAVHAQSTGTQTASGTIQNSQGTYDYYQGIIASYVSEANTALDQIGARATTTPDSVSKAKQYIANLSTAYTSAFSLEQSRGTAPVDAQIAAIQALIRAQQSPTNLSLISNNAASSPVRGVISQFSRNVSSASLTAEQIRRGELAANSAAANAQTDSNNSIVNAAAGNTNPATVTSTQSSSQCSLLDGNLMGCIDQLFAWFIKNTLLRLAGVILWLCANMLDFAMNLGILQFSKWAPPALYDLWIIVRQITSLAIVFAGLYLGFMYIIGREDTFGRYIGWVVIFALFVNFSYPLTRMLIDVSNIVSLNVYSSAIPSGLNGTGSSAGTEIMSRLGLQALVNNATVDGAGTTDLYKDITSTPVALITVVFVAYAAYIFFMATAILATRTAVLVFLTIGSPFLLIDSVVPKLGEVAAKMRRMFFEQLVVAPVFVIMLAITLKFMSVFRSTGALSISDGGITQQSLSGQTSTNITLFFSVLMMLIMLHIMLKVTKSLAGEAGNYATSFMGKVGGFGLAAATGGAGVLARGTIGQKAMEFRDSAWMDKMKDSKMGRGLYGLSNSLAQSTFDARNIGMVSKGLATAGLTGGMGLTMQGGSKKGFEVEQQARQKKVLEFGSNIRNNETRSSYFNKANKGFVYSKVDEAALTEAGKTAQKSKDDQIEKMLSMTDKKERETLINQALIGKDYALADKLRAVNQYHDINNTDADTAKKKADTLRKAGIVDVKSAEKMLKKDPFSDINKAAEDEIKNLEKEASLLNKNDETQKKRFNDIQAEIGKVKNTRDQNIATIQKDTLAAFAGSEVSLNPNADQDRVRAKGVDFETPDVNPNTNTVINIKNPGGTDTSKFDDTRYETPAIQRQTNEGRTTTPTPTSVQGTTKTVPPTETFRQGNAYTSGNASNDAPYNQPSQVNMSGTRFQPNDVKTKSFTSFLSRK